MLPLMERACQPARALGEEEPPLSEASRAAEPRKASLLEHTQV